MATAALEELFLGPTSEEKSDLGFTTAIPDGIELDSLEITDGVAKLNVTDELTDAALAQTVYTLTQFPTVDAVETGGRTYTRADFEDSDTGDPRRVTAPVRGGLEPAARHGHREHVRGDVQLRAHGHGRRTSSTRTSSRRPPGTGTRGTFDFTTKPYVPFDGVGALVVFELSAEGRLADQRRRDPAR